MQFNNLINTIEQTCDIDYKEIWRSEETSRMHEKRKWRPVNVAS